MAVSDRLLRAWIGDLKCTILRMMSHQDSHNKEIVYRLPSTPWAPWVIEEDGDLKVLIGIDFNRGYDIREYLFPITKKHLEVIRTDLSRHLLLWCVLEQLCENAGLRGRDIKPSKKKSGTAIDIVLLGSKAEVEDYFEQEKTPTRMLVAHGADIQKLEAGKLFASLGDNPSATDDWNLVWQYDIDRDRARRGIHLGSLDVALLKYLNKYNRMGTLPRRMPDVVEPDVLPSVLTVIAVAERACVGLDLPTDKSYPDPEWSKGWNEIDAAVRRDLKKAYPDLAEDTVSAISFLMGSEAADRARARIPNKG